MPLCLHNSRCTTSTTMTWASVRMRDGAAMREYLDGTKTQVQGLGLLWTSALEIIHLKDTQSKFQQNLPTFTTHLQLAQIQSLRCDICLPLRGIRRNLHIASALTYLCYLPVPCTPCTSQFHWWPRTSAIFTNIFYKKVVVIQNAIKLFHTFVELWPHSCS
jgi:hypothetical protein